MKKAQLRESTIKIILVLLLIVLGFVVVGSILSSFNAMFTS